MNLPDFLIVGVGKGGTSSLYATLARHPQLQRPRADGVAGKELAFFTERFSRGVKWYSAQFPERLPGRLLFEATPSYISTTAAPARIKRTLPDVRAIVLLRNPTARAWSDYSLRYANPPYSDAISRLLDANYHVLRRGIYVDQIKHWHSLFPRERLLVLQSETWFEDPASLLGRVCEFLGIASGPAEIVTRWDPWLERKARWGYEPLPSVLRAALDEFYRPHNERLCEYLGEEFRW